MALHNKKGDIMPKSVIYKGHRYVRVDNIEQRIKGIDATIKSCENTIKRKLIASAHELGEAQRIIIDTITKAMRGIGKPLNFLPNIQNNQKNNLKITLDFRLKPDIIKRLQGDV